MNHNVIDFQKARDLLKNGVKVKLNKREANILFLRNTVLIGQRDVVTEETVKGLFGEHAVKHVHSLDTGGRLYNTYGIGEYQQKYFTYEGFLTACTFNNVSILEREYYGG